MSCQYINSKFSLDATKEFMVTYAVTEEFPAVTMYSGDSANLTCGYQGGDKASIDWWVIQTLFCLKLKLAFSAFQQSKRVNSNSTGD